MDRKDDSQGKHRKSEVRVANPLAKLLEGHSIKPQSMKTIGQDNALKTVPSTGHLSEGNDKNVSILSSKTKYSSGQLKQKTSKQRSQDFEGLVNNKGPGQPLSPSKESKTLFGDQVTSRYTATKMKSQDNIGGADSFDPLASFDKLLSLTKNESYFDQNPIDKPFESKKKAQLSRSAWQNLTDIPIKTLDTETIEELVDREQQEDSDGSAFAYDQPVIVNDKKAHWLTGEDSSNNYGLNPAKPKYWTAKLLETLQKHTEVKESDMKKDSQSEPLLSHFMQLVQDIKTANISQTLQAEEVVEDLQVIVGDKKTVKGKFQRSVLTIVFQVEDCLIHKMDKFDAACDLEIVRKEKKGWSTKFHYKVRPGARELIEELSSMFEIGLYSNLPSQISNTIVQYLDPDSKHISFSLDSRHCINIKGESDSLQRKDLRVLCDRSLSDVFYVGTNFDMPLDQLSRFIPLVPYTLDKQEERRVQLSDLKDYLAYINSSRQIASHQDLSISEDTDPFSLQLILDNLTLPPSVISALYISSVKSLLS